MDIFNLSVDPLHKDQNNMFFMISLKKDLLNYFRSKLGGFSLKLVLKFAHFNASEACRVAWDTLYNNLT